MANNTQALTSSTISVTAASTVRSASLSHWLSAQHTGPWMLANLVGIAATLWLTRLTPVALTWAVFMALNVTMAVRAGKRDLTANRANHSELMLGLAATLGVGWGAAAFLVNAPSDAARNGLGCIAIGFILVQFGHAAFAHLGQSLSAMVCGYAIPFALFIGEHYGVFAAAGGTVFALLPLWLSARIQAHALQAVDRLFSQTLGALSQPSANSRDSDDEDFLHHAQSELGHLQQVLGEHRQLQSAVHALSDGIVCIDGSGRVEFINPVAEVLTGFTLREARGQYVNHVVCLQSTGSKDLAAHIAFETMRDGGVRRGDDNTALRRRDGVVYGIEYAVSARAHPAAGDAAPGAVFSLRDVTERRNALRLMSWRAAHDPLTGLVNRTDFEQRLHEAITREVVGPTAGHALLVLDIDHFTFINDTFGTAAADHLLKELAELLRQQIRGVDLLARLDGDRFGILLLHCPFDKAALIAEALRTQIERTTCAWQEHELNARVSVGLVEVTAHDLGLADLFSAADYACGCAKKAGGNRVHALRTSDEHFRRRDQYFTRIKEIQAALRYDRFELFFQSVLPIDHGTQKLNYCELLLRMRAEDSELVSPRDFLLTAERYHLLPELDRWTVKAALDVMRLNHPNLAKMDVIAINVSAQSVSDEKFAEFAINAIRESEVSPPRICFEIAESHLIRQWDKACIFIATVKELGCRVALDGFGLGTHSFQLLKRLHVDYLKVHEDFVRNITTNSVDYEVVLGISRVAKTLRIDTIASGVSNLATREVLRGMGVDYAQGFLVDQPRPVAMSNAVH